MRSTVARILLLVCALFAVVPATAGAATPPKVTSVAPLKLKIGDRMTIRGKGFLAGKNRNTVIFKATGARAVFVKAETATKTKLVVKVPVKLASFLKVTAGRPTPTRFQLRVLARRLSASYTPKGKSPVIAAAAAAPAAAAKTPTAAASTGSAAPAATTAPALSPYEQCWANARALPAGDADADGMPNAVELAYGVNPCVSDSDGDGMIDGYEYESARDLASHNAGISGRPYAGKKPWPNPLWADDAKDDFDGDGLTVTEEYALWWSRGHKFPLTEYSDGTQASGGVLRTDVVNDPLDLNHNGALTDDERDADGDGLSNVVELHLRGPESWWKDIAGEPLYSIRHFGELDPTVRDTDGNGVADGADDQDSDGYSNIVEMQLRRGLGGAAAGQTNLLVSPYNPCMPNPYAQLCSRYIPFGVTAWRPFMNTDAALLGAKVPFTVGDTDPPGWDALNPVYWDGESGDQRN
jgi:hypothetical protein